MVHSRRSEGSAVPDAAARPITGHIAKDVLQLFKHGRLDYKRVAEIVGLTKRDLSLICGVAKSSVRFDDAIPAAVAERLRGMANLANLVAELLSDDAHRVALWFELTNPQLGNLSPRAMICRLRWQDLVDFVLRSRESEQAAANRHGRDVAVPR